jgi:hypothetical protein
MAEIVAAVETARRPDEVFPYAANPGAPPRVGGQRGVGTPTWGYPPRGGLESPGDPPGGSRT